MHRAGYVEWGMELPRSQGTPLAPNFHVLTNLEAFLTPSFSFFMETSLYRHDCLNHWPLLVTELTSSSSPIPGGEGGEELKVPTF